ncbi:MAG: hypothetical protein LBL16_01495 [Endomicrobium sp.]|nr:hypothetical protein [Endomicrobium sp.]
MDISQSCIIKAPKNVLIIVGAAKYLLMLLEHKINKVDYIESDSAVIEFIKDNVSHLGYVFMISV